MPITVTEEYVHQIIETTKIRESLGEIESFYYGLRLHNMIIKIFLALLFLPLLFILQSYHFYYFGCTSDALILVRISALTLKPKKFEVIPWEDIKVKKVKKKIINSEIIYYTNGEKYKIQFSQKLLGWNKNYNRYGAFFESFDKRLYFKINTDAITTTGMKCVNCGREIESADQNFCRGCGNKIILK